MSRPTISDVAKHAGVSKTTVSRFLNGVPGSMREETRERILAAVKELGFRPNAVARSLAIQQTQTIGLLVSDVGNPFYSEVIRGIEEVGLQRGYRVLLCNTGYDLQRGLSFVDSLIHGQVDGVLLMTSRMTEALIEQFVDNSVPIILWDWPITVPKAVAQLHANFQSGIDQAIDHLVELGHRNIAYICGTRGLLTTDARIKSYQTALARHGLNESTVIEEGDYKIEGGKAAMKKLLQRSPRPTAVLTANDLTAVGAMQTIKGQNLRIPDDISVIGLDDVYLTTVVEPPLSTVALPRFEIGNTAMEIMIHYLTAVPKNQETEICVFATHLVLRESTAPPRP